MMHNVFAQLCHRLDVEVNKIFLEIPLFCEYVLGNKIFVTKKYR